MTKVIILAAGRGSRLKSATQDRPKCLIKFRNTTFLEWQIKALKASGLNDIAIVTGYKSHMIRELGYKTIHNDEWMTTNMVASLKCALTAEKPDDIIVSYGDIIYEQSVVEALLKSESDISVIVDKGFLGYWKARFKDVLYDLESLSISEDGYLQSIGQKVSDITEIKAQYIGLMRFRNEGLKNVTQAIAENSDKLDKMFMTDLLQHMINKGFRISPVAIKNKWLELDTEEDYKLIDFYSKNKNHNKFYNFSLLTDKDKDEKGVL